VPIIGCGGISNARDALEFIYAGACAVQVGTATFVNPLAPIEVLEGIEAFCRERGVESIGELVGAGRLTHRQLRAVPPIPVP
jgi:dihydroorotate dehydrogenase (NAD+) catalytic subunit